MNLLEELNIHAAGLDSAVQTDKKFFAAITHFTKELARLTSERPSTLTKDELKILTNKIENFFSRYRPSPKPESDALYMPPHQTSSSDGTVREINRLVEQINQLSDEGFQQLLISDHDINSVKDESKKPNCVFIGHGRSSLWARVDLFLSEELGLQTEKFESSSRTGEHVVDVLQQMLDKATFAVLILTAEDETNDGKTRARQNVVHEAGLFQGRLGFKRAVILRQQGLEDFSNVDGLQYIAFEGENIQHAFYELQRVLKREGIAGDSEIT